MKANRPEHTGLAVPESLLSVAKVVTKGILWGAARQICLVDIQIAFL